MKKTFLSATAIVLLVGCAVPAHDGSAANDNTPMSDPKPAQDATRKAARATLNRGITLHEQQQYAEALPLFEQAASQGDMKAFRYLGLMSFYGQGMPEDASQAFAQFKKGAEAGDITSQYWVGYLLEHGIGTGKDPAEAFRWYEKSAQRGDKIAAPAMLALSRFYRSGIATAPNDALADEYAQKALPLIQANEGNFLNTYPQE